MDPRDVLQTNLRLIDGIVEGVCKRSRVYGADAEDFAASVRLALIEIDETLHTGLSGAHLDSAQTSFARQVRGDGLELIVLEPEVCDRSEVRRFAGLLRDLG